MTYVDTDPERSDDLDPELSGLPLFRTLSPIAGYRIVRTLSEGPTGTVHEVVSPEGERFALKLAVSALDARLVLARFKSERPVLARTDHPAIVKIHDAGTTAGGQAYFVTQLVEGRPITDHCEAERLGPSERLGLFLRVCDALVHAHPMGIVHLGLRPSNVLVAMVQGEPVVRITDFGVVKATARSLTEETFVDEWGEPTRTPEYESPERATATPSVDRRADVYSLGALLYEMLCGVPPFDPAELRRLGLGEARDVVRTRLPRRPRACVPDLPRELDRIVMRALEKEPRLRHPTAEALAADVQRFLGGRPLAGLSRRAGTWVGILAVAVGLTGAGFGLLSLTRDRTPPTPQVEEKVREIFSAPPITAPEQAAPPHPFSVNQSGPSLPEPVTTIAEPAAPIVEPASVIREPVPRADESTLRSALEAERTPAALHDLAELYTREGRHAEAEPLLAAALQIVKRDHPRMHIETGNAAKAYGTCLMELGKLHEAENVLLSAHGVFVNLLGPAHEETVETVEMLVDLYERSVAPRVAAGWRSRLPKPVN